MIDTIQIVDLRGLPVLPEMNITAGPTTCRSCKREIVFVKRRHRWDAILTNELIDSFGPDRKTNLHDADCLGVQQGD